MMIFFSGAYPKIFGVNRNMVRTYKPDLRGKKYKKHSKETIGKALTDHDKGMSFRKCSRKYGIPIAVLCRRYKYPDMKTQGGQTVLAKEVEQYMAERIAVCSICGYPLDWLGVRCFVNGYLDKQGESIKCFKNNLPSKEWVNSFDKRNSTLLSHRMCQNVSPSRASVSPVIVESFFSHYAQSIQGVPPKHLLKFDETNLSDDPGRKKVLMKKGTKYPERIMSHSKSAVSIMYAGCADRTLLPPYVCNKAAHIYESWMTGGPPNARYNRSSSGWFEMPTFGDWFTTISLPHLKRLSGKKVMIVDNLSSHLSAQFIKSCEENNISFVFLPPRSTHFMQPLDVSFFAPLKRAYRKILEERKRACKGKALSIPTDTFPGLLKSLHNAVYKNAADNLKSGFKKCGLWPMNKEKPFASLPSSGGDSSLNDESTSSINDSLISVLQNMRYGDGSKSKRGRRKKIDLEPGKSVGISDFPSTSVASSPPDEDNPEDETGFAVDDYVIFSYEGELFPGQITAINEEKEMCEIRAMVKSGFN